MVDDPAGNGMDPGVNPEPRYSCACKAIEVDEPGSVRRSQQWVAARRGRFHVYTDRIQCGSWVIPAADIDGAIIHEVRQLLFTARVLEVQLADAAYQFGFNPWAKPFEHLPFEAVPRRSRLQWSPFSVVVRIALLALVIFLVITRR